MRKLLKRILQSIGNWALRISADNPGLEIEDRRRIGRRSIERQIKHLWDAHTKPPRLEGLLRKLTTRTRSDAEIQRAKEEKRIRNLGIKRFSDRPEYSLIVDFFKHEEANAYFLLRHGEEKPANITRDEFIGQQNGILYIIEKFRLMVSTAYAEIEMERAREEMKKDAVSNNKKREQVDSEE